MDRLPEVKTIGVVGAGQMGGGIAQVAAQNGFSVKLADVSPAFAEKAKGKIAAILGKQVEKGKLAAEARDATLANIEVVQKIEDFGACDFAIEAVTENFELKVELVKRIDATLPPQAFIASNTSSISLTKLAQATSRPPRVIGMHFFNPPALMKLVELVRALQTSDETWALAKSLAERMGKTIVTAKDAPGFIVNRMLVPLLNEACFVLQEGLGTPEDIDTGAKLGLNHPMGPLELSDLIGLDTMLAIADVFYREYGDSKYRAPTLMRNLVAAGWYGKKTGRGFYVYDEKGAKIGRAI